ncbi:hypothetical protein ACWF9G_22780 [Nocardia sp. NPDC055029]
MSEPSTTTAEANATTRVFDIAEVGEVTATISAPDDAGTVVYRLRGPRITGALSVAVGSPLHITAPETFAYTYGTEGGKWVGDQRERLTVNGVQLVGGWTITAETLAQSPGRVAVYRIGDYGIPESAPTATNRRGRHVVVAMLADFAARDDLAALWAAAARAAARAGMETAAEEVRRADADRTEAAERWHAAAYRLETLSKIAAGEQLRDTPAALLGHL